jgi:hypothetical protein
VEGARQASGRSRRAASGSPATAIVLFVLVLALEVIHQTLEPAHLSVWISQHN